MSKYSVKNRQLIRIQPNKCLQMLADHRTATIRLVERKNCFIFRWLKHAIERTFGRKKRLGLPLFDCSHTQPNFDSWDFDDSMDVRFQSFTYFLTVWKVIVCIAHRISIEEEFLSECHFFNEWSFFRSKTCNWSVTEKKETVFLLWGVIGRQPDGNQSTSQTVDRFKILQRIDGKKWSRTNSNRS